MSEQTTLTKERKSEMKFIPDVELPESELEEIFKLVKFAPSEFNIQHTHYVVVNDPELKEQIYVAADKQYKVKTATAVILVLGDVDAYKGVARINQRFLHLGVMNKQEYDTKVEFITNFYKSRGESFMRAEAIRNASLSAQLFMFTAKDKGWDTYPMIDFDTEDVSRILRIPDHYVPVMLIAVGKEDTTKLRPRLS